MKNFRILDGCHNCVNMRDYSDYDTGNIFACLLQYPELINCNDKWPPKEFNDDWVDEHGICDDYKRIQPK